jgi:hypothetical protein
MLRDVFRRYFNVVYNAEAVDIEKRYSVTSEQNSVGHFFMHPMVYDAEVRIGSLKFVLGFTNFPRP